MSVEHETDGRAGREVGGDTGGEPSAESGAGPVGRRTGPLASVVRNEALRDEADGRIRPDPARLAAGWERRFVIERGRAPDLVRLYEASGYEVALDPVPPELLDDECVDCRLVASLDYVSLYTRRREEAAGAEGRARGSTPIGSD